MNLNYFGILTILSYLSIALAQGLSLFGQMPFSRWRYFTTSVVSLSGHGWILYKLIETPQGQNLNWLIMLTFTLWLMNLFTFFTSFKAKVESLCVFTYPLAAVSVVLALSFSGIQVVDTKSQPMVLAHIFISLFAISLLFLASMQAVLMGFQHYLLKRHQPSPLLLILPPLQTMETLLFHILWSGMIFLSASLCSGFIFPNEFVANLSKSMLAISAWVLLTLLLVGRHIFGWRGLKAIRWTLSGTFLIFLSYFGTKAIL